MEKKFTEGNWSQTSSNHVKCDFNTIAYAYSMNVGDEQAKANAKLIASAPEMLGVLSTIENDNGEIPDWLWKRIKDVIKKATE